MIKEIDIEQWADPVQCVMLMWSTPPRIQAALDLMKRWGFTYKTVFFNWVKTYKDGTAVCGIGSYTRPSCELCLIGVRSPRGQGIIHWKRSSRIRQFIASERQEHSRKPQEARTRIDLFFKPELRRIELFARTTNVPTGWDVWGNETTKFDQKKEEKETTDQEQQQETKPTPEIAQRKKYNLKRKKRDDDGNGDADESSALRIKKPKVYMDIKLPSGSMLF
jgi:N6-adenosine-specific RNA methylase IME4